ncbi:MAG TPA: S8 family serine peptidase, partial [Pyrinomonadaceae bacterium]
MSRKFPLITLLILSLLSPLAGTWTPGAKAQGGGRARRGPVGKMTDALRLRARQSRPGANERARVILNIQSGADAVRARAVLENAGANIKGQMDELGMMVADVPVEKLSELEARDEISWMSQDQPVRSLGTNNSSHLEISTGASRVLPIDNEALATGGGGNKIGVAILDSGISPPDTAEFAGYEWKQSGGTLGTGLFSQTYLSTYNRIRKSVNFTGESETRDAYGHGTHTAGVVAGTGQSSEDY